MAQRTTMAGGQSAPTPAEKLALALRAAKSPSTPGALATRTSAATSQESIIMDLTRRLSERDAEVRSLAQKNSSLEAMLQNQQQLQLVSVATGGGSAYDTLLAHYLEQDKHLQLATSVNEELDKNLKDMSKMIDEMKNEGKQKQLRLKDQEEKSALQVARLAKLEEESDAQRATLKASEAELQKKTGIIGTMAEKEKEMKITIKKLRVELASHEDLVRTSKTLAKEHIGVHDKLTEEITALKEEMKKYEHTVKSKDALLGMQRQQMEEQMNLIQMYEKKFLAKDMDVPKLVARIEEGERLWSKIEEREKRFQEREVHVCVLRDDNANLQADKKALQAEVIELKKCFEEYNLMLAGTGDKVHMPWLLSQLRDTVQLKERIVELEEIIRGEGYTIKAAEAESAFKKREGEIAEDLKKLTAVMEMLKGQVEAVDDVEVPVLLGKLEEALLVLGYVGDNRGELDDIVSQILSATSSDAMSLNTNDSFTDDKWVKSNCITARDFRELMDPAHYDLMTSLAEGLQFGDNQNEEKDDASLEEREDIASPRDDGGNDGDEHDCGDADDDDEERNEDNIGKPRDIHLEKVLKIAEGEVDDNDWRNWIKDPASWISPVTSMVSPPSSPTGAGNARKMAAVAEAE